MEYIRVSVEVNGVVRGGHYGTTSLGVNNDFRRGELYSMSTVNIGIGFRFEWCV